MRKIPHPTYGNYGGAHQTCLGNKCPMPIDAMDNAFKRHDICLRKNLDGKKRCDEALHSALTLIDYKELKRPVYGHMYLHACLILFS